MPAQEEQNVIHNLFVNSIDAHNPTINRRILPSGSKWMADTKHANIIFSHPEVVFSSFNSFCVLYFFLEDSFHINAGLREEILYSYLKLPALILIQCRGKWQSYNGL